MISTPDLFLCHARGFAAERNPATMIFGFNTDTKVDDTVYHVQTEVRESERLLESQVFVSGRCIGKRSATLPPGAAEEEIQELARAQHRWVVEAVREGFVADVMNQEANEELAVQFLGSQRISSEEVELHFRVLRGGLVAASAQLGARWKTESSSKALEDTFTDDAGVAKMRLAWAEGAAELEVRAQLEGLETVRRFLVKSAKS
jgi:hypothetical protein